MLVFGFYTKLKELLTQLSFREVEKIQVNNIIRYGYYQEKDKFLKV